ncbi:MAG: Rpn family recombination-promoting nuclease/putative transposase [Spirochaetaceae bacterium]|jgi:hypothetical protein|nr:Rpn family recombination-promoting nuclease/putative transposase [Spirochaetaceae bacterium]
MSVNPRYKDSVFSLLFGNEDALRELYKALFGAALPLDVNITINTLENALYMTRINDLSFEVGGRLVVLVEHQSTINPNMAVRLLIYISRVYEKMLTGKNLYGRKRLTIPRPGFIVLYNGVEEYPDTDTLNLADAFTKASEVASALGIPLSEKPPLDLEVKVTGNL